MGTDPAPLPAKPRRVYSLNFDSTAGRVALILSGLFILGAMFFSSAPSVAVGFGISRETMGRLMGLPLITYAFVHAPRQLVTNVILLILAADFLGSTFTTRQLWFLVILATLVTGLGALVLFSVPLVGGGHIVYAFMGSCIALGRRIGWNRLNRFRKLTLVICWVSGFMSVLLAILELRGGLGAQLLFTISMLLGAALAWSWTRSANFMPGAPVSPFPGSAPVPPVTRPGP